MPEHEQHHEHEGHSLWPLIALGAAGTIVAAPFLLPALGLGTTTAASNATSAFHAHDIVNSSGLAGLIANGISHIPLIGESLAAGGWPMILSTGVIGIGGVLFSNWLKKREHEDDFPWSKVIRYGSLATSMLISLPSLLTGIGIGLTFLANFFISDAGVMTNFISGLAHTLGTAPMQHMGSGGGLIASMLPHILGCGASFIPISLAYFMGRPKKTLPVETSRYECRLSNPSIPLKGQPCELAFQLMDNETGRPLEESELEILHTRPLHTMVVDSSLRDYHHIHPEYDPARQCFVCRFTPQMQGSYSMWNDFTVKGETEPTHTKTELSPMRGVSIPARITHSARTTDGQIAASISTDGPLRAGQGGQMRIDLSGPDGRPLADLEPIMGAYAHLVAFSADGQHFIHAHPLGTEPQSHAERGNSPMYFHMMPEVAGAHQYFLQIQHGGRIHTLPFGQMVAQGREQANRGAAGAQLVNTIAWGKGR